MELILTPIEMRVIRRLPRERRKRAFKCIREMGYMKDSVWIAYCMRNTKLYPFAPGSPEVEYTNTCLVLGKIL